MLCFFANNKFISKVLYHNFIILKITCINFEQELISQRGDDFWDVRKKTTLIYDIVDANIKKFRMTSGMTQEQHALKISYTPEYIRRIESPKRKDGFSLSIFCVIAKAIDIHMAKFFYNLKRIRLTDSFLVSYKL